ncbi:MAG: hypothetical protein IH851_08770 [Armatimonadetes bacterium]|nr:hypothetical protein [Armatimonadota bacterium]
MRGHLLADEDALSGSTGLAAHRVFLFSDEVWVPAFAYVMVVTGRGETGWARSRDGSMVYHAYWNRKTPVWHGDPCPLHVLGGLHTRAPRSWGSDGIGRGLEAVLRP